jgi:hypothetical protein
MEASIYLDRDNKLFHAWTNRGQMVSSSSPPTTQWREILFKENSEPIFTLKYGHLWLPILLPFMYGSTYKWKVFGMTDF